MVFPKVRDKPGFIPHLRIDIGAQLVTSGQKVFDFNWADDVEEELFREEPNTMGHHPRDVSAKYIFHAWPTDCC